MVPHVVVHGTHANLLFCGYVKPSVAGVEPLIKRLAEVIQHGTIGQCELIGRIEQGQFFLGPLVQRRLRDEAVAQQLVAQYGAAGTIGEGVKRD